MTSNLIYAVGVLAAWCGAALLLRSLFLVVSRRGGVWMPGLAGLLLLVAASTPACQSGLAVPLLWVAMPFPAWAAIGCSLAGCIRLAQWLIDSKRARSVEAAVWFVVAIAFIAIYRLDPDNRIEVFRGHVALGGATAAGLGAFAVCSIGAMALVGKKAAVQFKRLALHGTLLTGSVIFGIPFAWMLITSFKEDRDMASTHGIIWIPRVQQTVPFLDPVDPLLQGDYQGVAVQGTLIGKAPSGADIVEILHPSSLRGISFTATESSLHAVPKDAPVVSGRGFTGFVARELSDGRRVVRFLSPLSWKGKEGTYLPSQLEPVRRIGLRTQNYSDALEAMPPEADKGLVYLKNTLLLVILSVVGTLLSSSIVAYGFARLRFPGRDLLFKALLATMMLPAAVTLLPQFLLFRSFGWIDTLLPLWVPAFLGSAFNIFLLRQFFAQIPLELEDAGKIDGAGVLRTYWTIMLPQIKPALTVVAIWTFIGAWNNFMGPLIYVNSPENMPLSYALQLFQSERGGDMGPMMAFATLTIIPVLVLFFVAQRYFIEGTALTGLGGR